MSRPDAAPTSFLDELKDAVTPRAVFLVVGVAIIQVAFIISYVGAFHHPEPHGLPVAVVAPPADAPQLVKALNGIPGHPLEVTAVPSVAAGTRQLLRRDVFGVLVVDPTAAKEQLLEASASGVSASVAVTDVLDVVAARYHRTVVVHDIRPPSAGDRNGLTSFYLVIGWIVGGYLVASILGISTGSRPANARRATLRLGAIAVYALVTGMAGAIVVGPILHALPGPSIQLGLLGALVIFCAGAFAMALLVVAGTIGIGVAIIVFVVLGNPSAGGPVRMAAPPTILAGHRTVAAVRGGHCSGAWDRLLRLDRHHREPPGGRRLRGDRHHRRLPSPARRRSSAHRPASDGPARRHHRRHR